VLKSCSSAAKKANCARFACRRQIEQSSSRNGVYFSFRHFCKPLANFAALHRFAIESVVEMQAKAALRMGCALLIRKNFLDEGPTMTEPELTFHRWMLLRDFVNDGLSLRRPDIQQFIHEGYLERNGEVVSPTAQGVEALKHEPSV